jgi:heme exporter protein B
MGKVFFLLVGYEIKITLRQAFSWLAPLLFFIIAVCLFPLAVGPEDLLLEKIAPGIIWISALLAAIISINDLFRHDAEQGYLDLMLVSAYPLTLWVLAKTLSHWITHCLPLIFIGPLIGLLLHLNGYEQLALVLSLLLGTPVLVLLGAMGAALIVGIRGHGLLLPVLIVPFYIPVLIFGTGAILAATTNQPISGYLAMMGALFLISLAFAPLFTGIALRIGVNQ